MCAITSVIPCWPSFPLPTPRTKEAIIKLFRTAKDRSPQPRPSAFVQQFPVRSRYAEAYRTLRTNLQFARMDKNMQVIAVTSSTAQEGKTNTVANLACTIAQTGQKVLMIDMDLRNPDLTRLFKAKKQRGLVELIHVLMGKRVADGDLGRFGLSDLVRLHRLQRRSGVLRVTEEVNDLELFFLKGDLIDVLWKNRPPERRLANILIKDGLLTAEQANIAFGLQKRSAQRLGGILRAMGLVSEENITRYLSIQIIEAFGVLSEMAGGRFTFQERAEDDLQTAIKQHVDFDRLCREFLFADARQPFLNGLVDAVTYPSSSVENLFLMPCGKLPPNPAELLSSPAATYVLQMLRRRFDFIVIDTAPVSPVSDALIMAPQTDGVLLVVKSGAINRRLVKDVIGQLEAVNAGILGVVLNQVDLKGDPYYKYAYYSSYYSSYLSKKPSAAGISQREPEPAAMGKTE